MAMASQIIASSSPTITKSHLLASYKTSKPYLSSCLGSSRFSPYIGLKHMGISISPKSSNPGVGLICLVTKLIPFFVIICSVCCAERKRRCSKGMVIRASLFGVGAPEALVIGVVALLVFGPKGLAEVARTLGKTLRTFQPTIRELQDVSRDFKSTLEREIGLDEISTPNVYNQNRMNTPPPPPPPTSVPSAEDPVTASSDPKADDVQSPKAYTTEDYLKITEEQLKALSPGEAGDQTQTQQTSSTEESQPKGTSTATSPPRQD